MTIRKLTIRLDRDARRKVAHMAVPMSRNATHVLYFTAAFMEGHGLYSVTALVLIVFTVVDLVKGSVHD